MRVAYITNAPFISGAERSLQTLLSHLGGSSIKPLVAGSPGSPMLRWSEEAGIECVECPLHVRDKWHPLQWLGSVRGLRRVLRREGIQLMHSNQLWSYPAAARAASSLGIPRVCHLRDEIDAATARWWLRDGAERVVCISRHIEGQFQRSCPGELAGRARVLLNPVPIPPASSRTARHEQRRSARQALDLREDCPTFGFIGQIVPVKNLPLMIKAMSAWRESDDWQAIIAGVDPRPGGDCEQDCRRMVDEFGLERQVRFLGFQDDVSTFYRAVDVVVVPSREEPLGRVPLEAAAYYKPAIVTKVGGLPETVRHGATGTIVPPGDTQALREAMENMRDMEYAEKLGEAARQFVERVASPQAYVQCLEQLYEGLLVERNAA